METSLAEFLKPRPEAEGVPCSSEKMISHVQYSYANVARDLTRTSGCFNAAM
jgi:hypothetical protein